jgi:small subunit ribosomal protein S4
MDFLVNRYKKTLRFYPEESPIIAEVKQKLHRLDIVPYNESIEVSKITRQSFLERRLQTLISKKYNISMAKSRQLITHGHVYVNDRKVTSPSFLVRLQNQPKIKASITSQ